MPFSSRSLKGVFKGSMRHAQNGFISRYSMRFVPSTMAPKNSRLMFIVSVSIPALRRVYLT